LLGLFIECSSLTLRRQLARVIHFLPSVFNSFVLCVANYLKHDVQIPLATKTIEEKVNYRN